MPVREIAGCPDLLSLHAADPERFPVLLETGTGDGWDLLLACPQSVRLWHTGDADRFFPELTADCSHSSPVPAEAAHLPFRGGWFLYLGYEMLHAFEPSVPQRVMVEEGFPQAAWMRVPAAIEIDRRQGRCWLFAEREADLDSLAELLAGGIAARDEAETEFRLASLVEEDKEIFLRNVAAVQQYIRAGDVFQVNLSRRFDAMLAEPADAAALYRRLRSANPVPFGGLARLGPQQAILSASPERLVRREGQTLLTRPIAGTWPREPDAYRDAEQRRSLLAHPKERAEHVMLVDLERNDLGRVCEPGSVRVEELMGVTTYAWVHHLESTVSGRLRSGFSPADVIRALFPGGTITGCPKVRTMQIIGELEPSPRLAYTGSMGYVNADGDMDLNILIRTAMLDGDRLGFSAGAGIVADSDPQRELAETRAKARGILRAFGAGQ